MEKSRIQLEIRSYFFKRGLKLVIYIYLMKERYSIMHASMPPIIGIIVTELLFYGYGDSGR